MVIGDFNAAIGKRFKGEEHLIGPFNIGTRNKTGEMLVDFMASQSLNSLNGIFNKNTVDRWTLNSPRNKKFENDYFLVETKENIKDFTVISDLQFQSDHRMLSAVVQIPRRPFVTKVQHNIQIKKDVHINQS